MYVAQLEIRCFALAEEIEYLRARELARNSRKRLPSPRWQEFYDAHAATELAMLMFNRLSSKSSDNDEHT